MTRTRLWTTAGLAFTAVALGGGAALQSAPAAVPVADAASRLSVAASDDAYTSSVRRDHNTGRADKLAVGRDGTDTKVSYLKFKVAPPAAGTAVAGARLRLTVEGSAAATTVTLSRVADTKWTERSLTAASAPKAGAAVATAKLTATSTTAEFDLDKVVTGPGTYAFALTSSATGVVRFASAQAGKPVAGGPQLRLDLRSTPPAAIGTPRPATATAAPATTAPTASPTASHSATATASATASASTSATASPSATAQTCKVDAKLVPSCGVLWGAAAGGFTDAPRDQALKDWEATSGRTATIFHQYHKGDELFPTKAEIAMAKDPAKPRVLLENWKVAYGTTWAKVAAGDKDARIDRWAAFVKANYTDKFFLVLHHEPENDVNNTAGSGMTAKDYAAMYRHVVTRLRAAGVTNAINVLAYMGNEKWYAQSWWADLYPGDSYVDWIGLDSYVSVQKGAYHYGTFADLLDRKGAGTGGLGFYAWATTKHPGKPFMVAEWGAYHPIATVIDKAPMYSAVAAELTKRPAIKAMVYFDTKADDEGDRDISIDSSATSLAAFRKLAADPMFKVALK